jgi:hypothetical protein
MVIPDGDHGAAVVRPVQGNNSAIMARRVAVAVGAAAVERGRYYDAESDDDGGTHRAKHPFIIKLAGRRL